MKKFLSVFFLISMLWALVVPTYATQPPIDDIETMREYLRDQCVPESFLDTVSDDMIRSLYQDLYFGGETVEKYSINFGQLNNQPMQSSTLAGAIPQSDFVLKCLVTKRTTGGNVYFGVRVTYEWLDDNKLSQCKNPFWRLNQDGIIVDWDHAYLGYVTGTFSYQGYAYNPLAETRFAYGERIIAPTKASQGALGVMFDLYRDAFMYLSGEMSLKLQAKSTAIGSGITNINAEYAHEPFATSGLSMTIGKVFTINFTGSYKSMATSQSVYL